MIGALAVASLGVPRAAGSEDHPFAADPRLEQIRSAFLQHDAAELARLFPTADRVYVDLPRFGVAGFFGPGPLRALLERLVAETRTRAFSFGPSGPTALAGGADRLYVKARWSYVETATGLAREEPLYLALRPFSGDAEWRIVELKATR